MELFTKKSDQIISLTYQIFWGCQKESDEEEEKINDNLLDYQKTEMKEEYLLRY